MRARASASSTSADQPGAQSKAPKLAWATRRGLAKICSRPAPWRPGAAPPAARRRRIRARLPAPPSRRRRHRPAGHRARRPRAGGGAPAGRPRRCAGAARHRQPPRRCRAQAAAATAFGLGIGAFDAARRGFRAAAEIDAEQLDAARFQHQQQARDQRIGHDETGQADARRQAAHAPTPRSMQAMRQARISSTPRQPPARAGRLDVIAPAPPGFRYSALCRASGTSMRQVRCRLAASIAASAMPSRSNKLGRRAGVARDGLLPQIAFLHMPKEAAGDGIGRDLAAQQGARHQHVEPQAPASNFAARARSARRAPACASPCARRRVHASRAVAHSTTGSGPPGRSASGRTGRSGRIIPPAAASARRGRRGWW
jgi:hypothetical protein